MSLNSTSGIRKQDAARVISQVAGNPLGRYMSFNFMREHWSDMKQMYVFNLMLSKQRYFYLVITLILSTLADLSVLIAWQE